MNDRSGNYHMQAYATRWLPAPSIQKHDQRRLLDISHSLSHSHTRHLCPVPQQISKAALRYARTTTSTAVMTTPQEAAPLLLGIKEYVSRLHSVKS